MTSIDGVAVTTSCFDCGIAGLALSGQLESGDLHVVAEFQQGTLLAVIDGLGHGHEAATAAKLAAQTLREHAQEDPSQLLKRCHERLRGTRGAVMSLATITTSDHLLTWAGVGNVEGVLLRAAPDVTPKREGILLRGGVVGDRLPTLRHSAHTLGVGDTLIFATDGIESGFYEHISLGLTPQNLARSILSRSGRPSDDALVLVAKYLGAAE